MVDLPDLPDVSAGQTRDVKEVSTCDTPMLDLSSGDADPKPLALMKATVQRGEGERKIQPRKPTKREIETEILETNNTPFNIEGIMA